MSAVSALRPFSGETAACDAKPSKMTRRTVIPRSRSLTAQWASEPGCEYSVATVSRNTPASMRSSFPPPLSSAGVPMSSMPTCRSFACAAARRNPPTLVIAMRLWPQPCPTSGSASYSAMNATDGPGGPTRARNAVSSPPSGRSARWPCLARSVVIRSTARRSWWASSGSAWMPRESATRSPRKRSRSLTGRGGSAPAGPRLAASRAAGDPSRPGPRPRRVPRR